MTFKTNLLPQNETYELGSSTTAWRITRINLPTTSGGTSYGPGTSGQVLISNGATVYWGSVSTTDNKVEQTNTTSDSDYRILLSGSANDTTSTEGANKNTNLRFNPSTQLFSVGGNISATGDLTVTGEVNLNDQVYAESLTADSLLVSGNANFVVPPTAPTPVAGTNDTSLATTAFVMNAFTSNDAMMFKGVVNSSSDLPATHYQGWTYRVATAGTYANKVCEVGDMIICITDGTAANDDHWAVIQNNVDGAVFKGTNVFTDGTVVVADNTAGKVKMMPNQNVNTVYAGPSSGSAAAPSFRTLAAADIPNLDWGKITTGNNDLKAIENLSGTSGFLKKTATDTWTLDTSTYSTTDTKNTAGSTNSTSKLYMIGATAQSANPQTYSHSNVYATSGVFAATSYKVAEAVTLQYNSTTQALDFVFA